MRDDAIDKIRKLKLEISRCETSFVADQIVNAYQQETGLVFNLIRYLLRLKNSLIKFLFDFKYFIKKIKICENF